MENSKSPRRVVNAFYEAEAKYMKASAPGKKASFDEIAATLDPAVVLHQSPDLPFGGEYVGHQRYEEWAIAMNSIFDQLEVEEQSFLEKDGIVVITCRFKTRSRRNGSLQDLPMVQVVTVEDGKITDFRPFYWNVPEYVAAAVPNSKK